MISEVINWRDASEELPDADSEVLVCYERNDCDERDVTLAVFDDSFDGSPWEVSGGLTCFGLVLYWANIPSGPNREGKA